MNANKAPIAIFVVCIVAVLYALILDQQSERNADARFVKNGGKKENHPTRHRLVLLHYHKTGHEICRTLAVMGFHQRFITVKHLDDLIEAQSSSNSSVIVVSGLDVTTSKTWPFLPSTRLVHFIRDPFDWSISAYLYHHQNPVPGLERKWITRTDSDRCKVHHRPNQQLGLSLRNVSNLCQSLSNVTALWQQLQQLSPWDGLRLEASRAILGASHGDLVKMARNIQYLKESANVMHVKLSQFTASEQSFQTTTKSLCRLGRELRNERDCAESFFQYGWLGNTNAKDPQHVTSNKISHVQREEWRARLMKDPVLGDPLLKVKTIVDEAT